MRWLLILAALCLYAQDDELARHAEAAAAAMQSGKYAVAEQENRTIVRLRPQMPEAEMNLGLSCFLQKKYVEAIRAFEAGLRLSPSLDNAKLFLGISRFKLNKPSAALPPLADYTAKRPDDFQGQYYLGLCDLSLDRFSQAESSLNKAHVLDPSNADVLYHLTQSYLGQARKDASRSKAMARLYQQAVEKIAAIDPNSYRLRQLKAAAYEADGNEAAAIQELEALFQHDPKAAGLHYTLGCLYVAQHRYEDARRQFLDEMRMDPPYPRTYLQLGHVYTELQKPADAIPLLRTALDVDPQGRGQVWAELGRAYRVMNKTQASFEAYEKAVSLGEKSSAIYYQLSMVARRAGNLERSREALELSQKLRAAEPKNTAAKDE
jgi:tetratricopeptide (TPR) repeat protein